MGSLNYVILIGRLGAKPEMRTTRSGKSVCTFPIATEQRHRGESGDAEPAPQWHRIETWERTAELCHQYLDKGRQVAVEGRLKTDKYTAADGATRYWTCIVARRVTFLGGGQSGGGSHMLDATLAAAEGGGKAHRPLVADIPF